MTACLALGYDLQAGIIPIMSVMLVSGAWHDLGPE
jgi:hypothetical protein